MFKVGEYCEDEAKSIAGYLRDAGFKVVEGLVEEPGKGKTDIEDFAARCILDAGDKFTVSVDASLVAE